MKYIGAIGIAFALIFIVVWTGAADSSGQTQISAKILEVLSLKAPGDVSSNDWILDPADADNAQPDMGDHIEVSANIPWQVMVKAEDPGNSIPSDRMWVQDSQLHYHYLAGGSLRMDIPDASIYEFTPDTTDTKLHADDAPVNGDSQVTFKQAGSFDDLIYDPGDNSQLAYHQTWTFTIAPRALGP